MQPDLEFAAQDVEKFFPFVGVGFTAGATGLDAEEMRLHGGVAPGEKFHADLGTGFENLALGRANKVLSVTVRFKHGKDIGFVKTRDALKCGDRGTHLASLERAEKTYGNFCCASDLGEGQAAFNAQTAEALAGRLGSIGGSGDDTLFFENVNNRGGIEAASAT